MDIYRRQRRGKLAERGGKTVIKDKIRNEMISIRSFTFSKSNKNIKVRTVIDGGGDGLFTREESVGID